MVTFKKTKNICIVVLGLMISAFISCSPRYFVLINNQTSGDLKLTRIYNNESEIRTDILVRTDSTKLLWIGRGRLSNEDKYFFQTRIGQANIPDALFVFSDRDTLIMEKDYLASLTHEKWMKMNNEGNKGMQIILNFSDSLLHQFKQLAITRNR